MMEGIQIITEVKTASPFGWKSQDSWEELFAIANGVGDILSIHTDPRWEGSFDLLQKARSMTTKPILAKGIHLHDSDIEKAVAMGADFVLVVGRIPEVHLDKCLLEPNTLAELKSIPTDSKVVWNSRDLKTGGLKGDTFKEAREIFPGWLCQSSNIHTVKDIEPGANAVLVGTNLKEFTESMK